jgi:NADH dehydrogenase
MHVSGWIAWALWRAIYLAKLPGTAKNIRVGLDWTLDAVFGREVAAVPGVTAHNPSLTKERTGGKD